MLQDKQKHSGSFGWLIKIVASILCFLFLQSCNKDSIPTESVTDNSFAIYLLKDNNLKAKDIYNKDINSLQLAEKPWMSASDISFYDFSSHCMVLKKSKKDFLPNYDTAYFPPPEWTDKPFVVTANGKPCYAGYIINVLYPYIWPFASMETDIGLYPEDIFHISYSFLYREDIRNNLDVKKALIAKGLFHAGTSFDYDSLYIYNGDTASIKYSVIIKNNDIDNLYVIDPAKCGDTIFNLFCHPPYFYNLTTKKENLPVYFTPNYNLSFFVNWKTEWFTLLEPGASIKREIFIKGYRRFGNGEYLTQTILGAPYHFTLGKKYKGENRFWIGSTNSNVLGFTFNDSAITVQGKRVISNEFPKTLLNKKTSLIFNRQ